MECSGHIFQRGGGGQKTKKICLDYMVNLGKYYFSPGENVFGIVFFFYYILIYLMIQNNIFFFLDDNIELDDDDNTVTDYINSICYIYF